VGTALGSGCDREGAGENAVTGGRVDGRTNETPKLPTRFSSEKSTDPR
jgi:hypothetical protein